MNKTFKIYLKSLKLAIFPIYKKSICNFKIIKLEI